MLDAAVSLADEKGIASLSMRGLAKALEVEAMSLYHHVANKEAVLDGMVDLVFSEIDLPRPGDEWKAAMRARAGSAREALQRHPWAVGLMDSRRYRVLACHRFLAGTVRSLFRTRGLGGQ